MKKSKSKSTALARRPKPAHVAKRKPTTALARRVAPAAPPQDLARQLSENVQLEDLGIRELKLKPEEEAVLQENVRPEDIRVLPDSTGTIYLPHIAYTRWLNRAFGRLGWALVPASMPKMGQGEILQPFKLFIHGVPVAIGYGQQEYHENNKKQSHGDAIESTHAAALRRCCKHLGMGLELWDKEYADEYIRKNCVLVTIKQRDDNKRVWRKKTSPPFWNEVRAGSGRAAHVPDEHVGDGDYIDVEREAPASTAPAVRHEPAAAHHAQSGEPISQKQAQRLWVIARNSGRSDEEIKGWLQRRFGLSSSKLITRRDYESICKAIEAPGTLPER